MSLSPIYFVPTRRPIYSITFDDGPVPGVTDKLLTALDHMGAKATFFMVGETAQKNPGLAKEVVAAGHSVGTHSHRHMRGMKTWSATEATEEFRLGRDAVEEATGTRVSLVRPPFGNVCPEILDACRSLNLTYIGWSVHAFRLPDGYKDSSQPCTRGSIVLFHDGGRVNPGNVSKTINECRMVVESQRSYSRHSVTVDELIGGWDDDIVSLVDGRRCLGWHPYPFSDDDLCLYVAYWHPDDVISGMTYGLDINGGRAQSAIPPMSNVDEWLLPVVIRKLGLKNGCVDLGSLFTERYNPPKEEGT